MNVCSAQSCWDKATTVIQKASTVAVKGIFFQSQPPGGGDLVREGGSLVPHAIHDFVPLGRLVCLLCSSCVSLGYYV